MYDFNYQKETLCKELAGCIVQTRIGPMIKHHFINICYWSEPHKKDKVNGMWNETLRLKKKYYEDYLNENDFESISWLIERPWRITWLYANKELVIEKVGIPMYYEILGDVFNDTENAHEHKDVILELFYFGGNPLLMMREEELEKFQELPDVLKIWRGVESGEDVFEIRLLGCSWTLDFEKALWFAKRGRGPINEEPYPLIFELEIKKEEVLSFITRRNESEIILDHTKIDIERVKFIYPKDSETNHSKEVDVSHFQSENVF
jgi:hypothetical protein